MVGGKPPCKFQCLVECGSVFKYGCNLWYAGVLCYHKRFSVVVSFLFRFEAVLSGGSGGFPYFVAYVFPFVSSVRKVGQWFVGAFFEGRVV